MYAGDPKFVGRTVEKLAGEARAEQKASVDAWARALQEDARAMKEMEEAAAEYAKEQGYEAPEPGDSGEGGEASEITVDAGYDSPDDDWWYSWYGWCWAGDGIVIGDTPCGGFIEWLLEHGDRFPNLGDRVIHHFQERRADGRGVDLPGELADAVGRWQSKYPLTTMQGFMNDDGQRAQRLRELGQAIREAPGGGAGVQQLVARDPQRFPNLTRPAGADRGAAPPPATRPAPPAGAAPAPPIRRVQPSPHQQYQRAVTRHRTAWGGRPPAYRPAGGMRGRGGRGRR